MADDMIARLRGRLAESGGFTLTEMMVVMAILGVIVAGLTQLFLSGSKAEADMSNRFRAQQNARLALDGLRREIHCASAVVGTPTTSSLTITLPSYCPTNGTGADTSVTWCTARRRRSVRMLHGAYPGRFLLRDRPEVGRQPLHRSDVLAGVHGAAPSVSGNTRDDCSVDLQVDAHA